ncbi:hypothetical protein NPIL_367551 [Nephila pilipes]|uniref:Uncharacterized protein n=1 Tax=Nephila pilipes TaxID=299642 RepID=A0A8X6TBA4_NEPPI|nr:hypothetical protein NPIL_367551 [Nephila pilipes]
MYRAVARHMGFVDQDARLRTGDPNHYIRYGQGRNQSVVLIKLYSGESDLSCVRQCFSRTHARDQSGGADQGLWRKNP